MTMSKFSSFSANSIGESMRESGIRARIVFVVLAIVGCTWLSTWLLTARDTGVASEELVQIALEGATRAEQTTAAIRLADYGGQAREQLRRLFNETNQPDVQAACIEGLGKLWDYESMDQLLNAVESGAPKVRGRAAVVISRLTGRDRRFQSDAPAAQRRRWVGFMREDWEEIRNSPYFGDLQRRLRESHDAI